MASNRRKLFQHIVREPELKGAAAKIEQETAKVFKGQGATALFAGIVRKWVKTKEDAPNLGEERKEVVTTVQKRLDWNKKPIIALVDYELTRDVGNTLAKADLVVDGITLAKDAPATFLLSLEKRLRAIRNIYNAIPTLDLAVLWEAVGNGIFKHGPNKVDKTRRITAWETVVSADAHHPAQVKEKQRDEVMGYTETTHFSGAVHPGLKAAYLEQIDKLIEATKDARMRANDMEVTEQNVGEAIFKFIHNVKAKE